LIRFPAKRPRPTQPTRARACLTRTPRPHPGRPHRARTALLGRRRLPGREHRLSLGRRRRGLGGGRGRGAVRSNEARPLVGAQRPNRAASPRAQLAGRIREWVGTRRPSPRASRRDPRKPGTARAAGRSWMRTLPERTKPGGFATFAGAASRTASAARVNQWPGTTPRGAARLRTARSGSKRLLARIKRQKPRKSAFFVIWGTFHVTRKIWPLMTARVDPEPAVDLLSSTLAPRVSDRAAIRDRREGRCGRSRPQKGD